MQPIEFIEQTLNEAMPAARRQFQQQASLEVNEKTDVSDLVTETDLAVQKMIAERLEAAFPGEPLVAEEEGLDQPPANGQRCWVLDPIDGTHNFARGLMPAFGISLALVEDDQPLAAGIALPGLGDAGSLFLAEKGRGATRDGHPTHVSSIDDPAAARMEIDLMRRTRRDQTLSNAARLLERMGQVRCHGSAVVGLCAVAAGAAEGCFHAGPRPWDFAAGLLIVTEAGGTVTRLNGQPPTVFEEPAPLLASNTRLHQTLLDWSGEK